MGLEPTTNTIIATLPTELMYAFIITLYLFVEGNYFSYYSIT